MTAHCCSDLQGTTTVDGPLRRCLKAAGSVLPGAAAILLPKCPLCLAAWFAAGTGIVLPAVLIDVIRPFLVIACILSAAFVLRRVVAR